MPSENQRIRVVVDAAIPYIRGVIEPHAEVEYLDGSSITAAACRDAHALVVRTRTQCNEALLQGGQVRLIASATIGTDHIDLPYCAAQGIQVANAPGCNAWAVVQWVVACMLHINRHSPSSYQEWLVGIVGVGSIGSRLADVLEHFGVQTLLCDPYRQGRDARPYVPLSRRAQDCDLITLHVPHTETGEYPTHHLLDRAFFQSLRQRPYIFNASRGGVVDDFALLEAKQRKRIRAYCLDVYEDEPDIAPVLLECAEICTPHIAGYSLEGKRAGTQAALDALSKTFALPPLTATSDPNGELEPPYAGGFSMMEMGKTYDVAADMRALRRNPQDFERLRNRYLFRNDWRGYKIGSQSLEAILEKYI